MRAYLSERAGILASWRFLVVVLLTAFALRAGWAVVAGDHQRFADSDSYVKIADNLIAGNGFLWGEEDGGQRLGRPPLYPLLVAATRFRFLGREFLALYLVQAVLGTLAVLFFSLGAGRLLGREVGGTTALVLSVYPFLVYYTGAVLSEALFIFLLSGFFYFLVVVLKRPGLLWGLYAGLFAGLSFLTRPSIMGLVGLLAVVVVIRVRPRWQGLIPAAAMIGAAFLVALPWAVRNRRVTGKMIFSTCGVGASLYDGLGPQADGSSDMSFLHSMPELAGFSEVERDRYLRAKALEAARERPRRVLVLAIVKAYRFWAPMPNSKSFRGAVYTACSLVAVLPIYLLAMWGLLRRAMRRRDLAVLLAAPLYFTLLHMVFVASTRYRAPVMPFVVIIASAGIASLLRLGGGRHAARGGGGEAERNGEALPEAGVAARLESAVHRRRRRLTIPFKIFLVLLGLLVLAGLSGYTFYHWWLADPENVRTFAQGKISHLFPGKQVTVGSAEFSFFAGLDLYDVKVVEPEESRDIATLKRVHIDFDLLGLADSTFKIKNVAASDLFLDLVRSPEGEWNLKAPGRSAGAARQDVFSTPFSVGLQGAFVSIDDEFTGYSVSFPIDSASAMSRSEDMTDWRMSSEFGGNLIGKWRVSARWDVANKLFDLQFAGIDIDLGRGLRSRIPPRPRRSYDKFSPSGIADVSGRASYDSERLWDFDIKAVLKGCGGGFYLVPAVAEDLVGTMVFKTDGVRYDALVGKVLGGAVQISGSTRGYGAEAGVGVLIETQSTVVDQALLDTIPEKTRAVVESFAPRGRADLSVTLERRPGPKVPYEVSVVAIPKGLTITYDAFPLAISGVTGRIENTRNELKLIDLAGKRGEMAVECNGTVTGKAGAKKTDILITASRVPLDEELRVLLPEKAAEFWKSCAFTGEADAAVGIAREPGGPFEFDLDVAVRGLEAFYEKFPYELTGGEGGFRFAGGVFDIERLDFRHGPGRINLAGRADVNSGEVEVKLAASQLPIDEEFVGALPGEWHDVVEGLALGGHGDMALTLSRESDGVVAVRDMSIQMRGGRVMPSWMPVAVGGVNASVGYVPGYLDVKGLEGWVCADNSLALMPFVRLAYVARPSAKISATGGASLSKRGSWYSHIDVGGISAEEALVARLPEGLRMVLGESRVCGFLDLLGDVEWDNDGDEAVSRFDLRGHCTDFSLVAGRRFESLYGQLEVKGQAQGGGSAFVSLGRLERLRFDGREMGQTEFLLEKTDTELKLQSFQTQTLGGSVKGQGRLGTVPGAGYGFSASFEDLALAEVIRDIFGFKKEGLTGKMSGRLEALSLTDQKCDLMGRVEANVTEGTLWEVPVVLAVLDVFGLLSTQRAQFEGADIQGSFARGRLMLDEFTMRSDPATILGEGTIGFDGELDMMFYSRPGRIPIVREIAGEVGRNIVKAKMTGSFESPQVKLVPSGVLGKLLGIFKRKQP